MLQEYIIPIGDAGPLVETVFAQVSDPSTWVGTLKVSDTAGNEVINRVLADEIANGWEWQLSGVETTALGVDAFLVTVVADDQGGTVISETYGVSVEPATPSVYSMALERGVNSFGSYGDLLAQLNKMPSLTIAQTVSRGDLRAAMVRAWQNIGQLTVDFDLTNNLEDLYSTLNFTVEVLDSLTNDQQRKLIQAQLIEADFLLGGNPIEHRRRAGLMSDSTGEQAQFFRPSKPVVLPVCRDAAVALTPHVRYTAGAGRG